MTKISIEEFKALQKGQKRQKSNFREAEIQKELCKYVRLKYPTAIFNCDCSGLNLSKAQSGIAKAMRSNKGFPDFVLYQMKPNRATGTGDNISIYGALFIELKAEGTKFYSKDGMKFASPHIADQMAMIDDLKSKGYKAGFACGTNEAIKIIDNYMKL